jgi:hypothetical protein
MKNNHTIILISAKDIGIYFVEREDGNFKNNTFVNDVYPKSAIFYLFKNIEYLLLVM